jgi:hypothetical protein
MSGNVRLTQVYGCYNTVLTWLLLTTRWRTPNEKAPIGLNTMVQNICNNYKPNNSDCHTGQRRRCQRYA